MYTISNDFRLALKGPHRVISRAEVLRSGIALKTLYVAEGSVTVDSTAAIRRRCNVTLTDEDGTLTPASAADLLTPFGNELRIWRGIRFVDGAEEMVPLGVFTITSVAVDDTGPGVSISVEAYDRARKVEEAQFTQTSFIAANTNVARAIRDILLNRVPSLQFNPDSLASWYAQTTPVTPNMVFNEEDDAWKIATEMAQSIGRDLYFDVNGLCTMPLVPDPATSPVVWSYAEGAEATLLGTSNEWTREFTYNHIIITGESTSNPIPYRGEAKDNDPGSPTYVGGPMGDVPYFLLSKNVTSDAQALEAATGILRGVIGATELVRFGSIVNPAHEAGDVVSIVRAKSKINNLYVLDQFDIPLSVGSSMSSVTRRQRKA